MQIPKLRRGSYVPSFLQPRKRSEQALVSVVQQAYVCGVSTRRVDQLVESQGLRISKSEVSRIAGTAACSPSRPPRLRAVRAARCQGVPRRLRRCRCRADPPSRHGTRGARRFRVLDAFLLECLSLAAPISADIGWAWRRLVDAAGDVRIDKLVTELGCSRRHLSRRFKDEIGMTPKAYARVLRFEHAMAMLVAGDEPGDIAFACGYADQPHFNREFLAMAGVPPSVALAPTP